MFRYTCLVIMATLLTCSPAWEADQPQWGQLHSRNMVSTETGLPSTFDPETGQNIKWSVELGQNSYTTPIIAGGKVLVGTDNERLFDPRWEGDRAVLLCLSEQDGSLIWQLPIPKFIEYQDWPHTGLSTVPTVEGNLIYMLTNRGEVMCLDLDGLADGNDGPFTDEGRYLSRPGEEVEAGPLDGDILWVTSLIDKLGVHPHDTTHGSVLIVGDHLYVNTSNGVDALHKYIPALEAPGIAVLDKATGRILAVDGENMGPHTVHCTWSSPSFGMVNGNGLICFGGGDGVCYGFEPVGEVGPSETAILKRIWRFDCDPQGPKEKIHQYKGNLKVSPSNITGMPVFVDGRIYVEAGGDLWHGKTEVWLKCIDASQSGTVTHTAQVWSYPLKDHCMSTPAVSNDLVFIGDCGQRIHCIDRKTGMGVWQHDGEGEIWGSPMVADGKVYIGTRSGDFWIFAAEREKKVLAHIDMKAPVQGTSSVANGVLYVAAMNRLYAITEER